MDSWPAPVVPDLPGRGPEPVIWDTSSGSLTAAAPGSAATLYACGITPYDATHIGHAATFVAWDLLVRAWLDAGKQVSYVQNVTDVDDPLLERANRDGEDWRALADRDIELYRSDMTALRVLPPGHFIGAVEALPLIERLNRALADRGAVYELDGDVYFSRAADPAFGSVSGLDGEAMYRLAVENGGDPGRPGKKDPVDPLVWLARRRGEPSWRSRFGPGRPGWHVECAAIATHYLGDTFDVQAGGRDLIFPHHEMSASHARVALGGAGEPPFARRYVHAGMVRLDGEKMSKSLGNLVFVSGLLATGHDPMIIRLAILAHHYRSDWDWTDAALSRASERLANWRAAARLGADIGGGVAGDGAAAGTASAGGGVAVDGAAAGTRGAGAGGSGDGAAGGAASAGGSGDGAAGGAASAGGSGDGAAGGAASAGESGDGAAGGTASGSESGSMLAAVRERLADDLDAPGALAVMDAWAASIIAEADCPSPELRDSAALMRVTADALLGVAL
jgi:L-cysteine:1D-myo-inositol 2-amino-2-deoxy-alpha-D-glucopyranoside ligase